MIPASSLTLDEAFEAIHQFSTKSWNLLRLVIVACAGDGHPVRVYVIQGPAYTERDGWTAFILVHQYHLMPMCVRSAQFSGEAGGSRFLRHALTYGVAPTVMHARDWSNLCPEERAAGPWTAVRTVD